jgi:methyl-accepting chemotaxis protein
VADEISKLADQNMSSIGEIDRFIRKNNEEIEGGMAAVRQTISILENILSGVRAIGEGDGRAERGHEGTVGTERRRQPIGRRRT